MKGDIAFAGFVFSAEEWQELDAETRGQLIAVAKRKAVKLGFKDARELEELPALIESLETEQEELSERLSQPAFYRSDAAEQARVHARREAVASELESSYARWYALEALRDGR